ncbi:MAG TPA: hypothetical protein VML50_13585 [Anaeromyxobacter sp.]|nr:hypothetical protein [Anaeromyxobacter sp.]
MSGPNATSLRLRALPPLLLALAACSDTLVDHNADPALLNPSACTPVQTTCGGVCVAEDAAHCGTACADCTGTAPPDPNATPACVAHACGFECNPGWLRSGTACRRAQAISAGFAHTCALLSDGAVKCWGANDHGQLGDGTLANSAVPVDVALPAAATALAAGYVHTCAVAGTAHEVFCWGDNTTGNLGDGTTLERSAPVQVSGLSGAGAIAAGGGEVGGSPPTFYGHTCAAVAAGVECWGSNESGQLGDDSTVASAVPVQTQVLTSPPSALSVGDRHTCALVGGAIWCWGSAGSYQLGNGNPTNQPKPIQAIATGATALAAGAAHTCAVVSSALQCWGSNSAGQANGGDNSQAFVQTPAGVTLAGFAPTGAAGGNAHTCAVDAGAGKVTCFGANDQSQLSGAPTARGNVAVPVTGAAALTAGYDHSCALLADGGVQCWGQNDRGQTGTGAPGAPLQAPTFVSGR